jgi:hypothetical protein
MLDANLRESDLQSDLGPRLSGVDHLGACRTISIDTNIEFPEPNFARLLLRARTVIEVMAAPFRFFQRKYFWTGSGVHNPPRIYAAKLGPPDLELHAIRHGPFYSIGMHRAFLIDLGQEMAVGDRVSVETRMQFVDEDGTFEPFHSVTANPGVTSLDMSAAFLRPPDSCTYSFRELSEDTWSEPEELEPGTTGNLTTYSFSVHPPRHGKHRISW